MTTTLITRSLLGRARTDIGFPAATAYVPAPFPAAAFHVAIRPAAMATSTATATATTTEMNLWLGGDVQGSGFCSNDATKRITPGRLEGVT